MFVQFEIFENYKDDKESKFFITLNVQSITLIAPVIFSADGEKQREEHKDVCRISCGSTGLVVNLPYETVKKYVSEVFGATVKNAIKGVIDEN